MLEIARVEVFRTFERRSVENDEARFHVYI